MVIVFDSPQVHVVEYPGVEGLEVVDKRSARIMYMREGVADQFREQLAQAIETEDDDVMDDLLDQYTSMLLQPAVYH